MHLTLRLVGRAPRPCVVWRLRRAFASSVAPEAGSALAALADHLSAGRRVLFVTGAGLSAPSGVPTYRGSADSVWTRYVQEWGTRRRFFEDPLRWYNEFWLPTHALAIASVRKMAQERNLPQIPIQTTSDSLTLTSFSAVVRPNAGHTALNRLAAITDANIITQNVDGLQLVDMEPDTLAHHYIEAHGRADRYRCPPLRSPAPSETLRFGTCVFSDEEILTSIELPIILSKDAAPRVERVPSCPSCGAPVLPAVLLFDELYTDHKVFEFDRILRWIYQAEVMVFIGTSNSVGLTQKAHEVGLRRGIPMFDMNVEHSAFPGTTAVQGAAEELLPRLYEAVRARPRPERRPLSLLHHAGVFHQLVLWEYVVQYLRPALILLAAGYLLELLLSSPAATPPPSPL